MDMHEETPAPAAPGGHRRPSSPQGAPAEPAAAERPARARLDVPHAPPRRAVRGQASGRTPGTTAPRPGRRWRRSSASSRAAGRWRSPPAWPRQRPCSTCCPPAPGWSRPTDCYSGVKALFADGEDQGRWTVELVDVTDTDAVLAAAGGADLLWLESPDQPAAGHRRPPRAVPRRPAGAAAGRGRQHLRDAAAAAAARAGRRRRRAQRHEVHRWPLRPAARRDVAGDGARGAAADRRRELAGATPGALETFLALRGVRTLALRVEQGQRSAGELARRLAAHPAVHRVRYPGLPDDPGHARAARADARGRRGAVVRARRRRDRGRRRATPSASSPPRPASAGSRARWSAAPSGPVRSTCPRGWCA